MEDVLGELQVGIFGKQWFSHDGGITGLALIMRRERIFGMLWSVCLLVMRAGWSRCVEAR